MEADRLNSYRGKILVARERRRKYLLFTISAFVSVLSITIINQTFNARPKIEVAAILEPIAVLDEPVIAIATEVEQPSEVNYLQLDMIDTLLATSSINFENFQAELAVRDSKIDELQLAQELFQAELDNAYKDLEEMQQGKGDLEVAHRDLQNLKQVVEAFPAILERERLANKEEVERWQASLSALQKEAELAKLGYEEELLAFAEKNNQYKQALEENSLFVVSLEEEMRLRLGQEGFPEVKFDQQQMRQELVELQESFQQERTSRLAKEALLSQKEDLLTQLAETLRTQKDVLQTLEQARLNLVEELAATKRQYADYHSEISAIAQVSPKILPDSNAAGIASKTHVVNKGETLSAISMQYYGTTKRWDDIYEANKTNINNKNQIKAGTTIVIP